VLAHPSRNCMAFKRALVIAASVGRACCQSYESSPYDGVVDSQLSSCGISNTMDAAKNVSVTQTGSSEVMLSLLPAMTSASWGPVWLTDSSGTIVSMVQSASTATLTMSWVNLSWTSEPEELYAWALDGCDLSRSDVTRTWRGSLQSWRAARGQHNRADAPPELRTSAGLTPFRPNITFDWPNRRVSVRAPLTLNTSANSLVSFVYLQLPDGVVSWLWDTSSDTDYGSGGEPTVGDVTVEGGVFESGWVAFPPQIERILACSAVVYDTECAELWLVPHLVADLETAHSTTTLDASTQTLLVLSSPSWSVSSIDTTVLVRATPACGEATLYARGAASEILGFSTSGSLTFHTPDASLTAVVLCAGSSGLAQLLVDVAALRVANEQGSCTLDGVTYAAGAPMPPPVDALPGTNCTCAGTSSAYCVSSVPGDLDTEGGKYHRPRVPMHILVGLLGGLLLQGVLIYMCVWRTQRLRREQDEFAKEEGVLLDENRTNFKVLMQSVVDGGLVELPGEDRRQSMARTSMRKSRMSGGSKAESVSEASVASVELSQVPSTVTEEPAPAAPPPTDAPSSAPAASKD